MRCRHLFVVSERWLTNPNKRRISKFLILSLLFVFFVFASVTATGFSPPSSPDSGHMEVMQQSFLVTGTISDAIDVLPGASVFIKGTTTGMAADIEGKFSIIVPSQESVLVFSFIGYVPQEVIVGDRRVFNITLVERASEISEVAPNRWLYTSAYTTQSNALGGWDKYSPSVGPGVAAADAYPYSIIEENAANPEARWEKALNC